MSKLYPRLALQNIRRDRQFYLPYLLTILASCAAFYMVSALDRPEVWPGNIRYQYLSAFMGIGSFVIGLFALIFLTYTGRFLAKRRQRELGLYNILGMGKGHIALTLGLETFYLGTAGILGGILAGMAFQGLATALLCILMGLPPIYSFSPSPAAVLTTTALFAAILFFNLLLDLARVKLQKPVELLRESSVGEKEPKARWLLALLGVAALGSGYAIALLTRSAIDALALYFLAVLLVIVGTYCLFTAVSIVVLKLLKRNKSFYYQTSHFIGLSGMLYRMKRNAVGLANICILCTMVLVMVSGTLMLYLGSEEQIPRRYPGEVTVSARYDPAAEEPLDAAALDLRFADCAQRWGYDGVEKLGEATYASVYFVVEDNGLFREYDTPQDKPQALLYFMPYETYEQRTGLSIPHDGAAHIYREGGFGGDTLTLDFGAGAVVSYPVGQSLETVPDVISALMYVGSNDHYIALPAEALADLSKARLQGRGTPLQSTRDAYWDLGGDPTAHAIHLRAFRGQDWTGLGQYDSLSFDSRQSFAEDYYALNGGFFFLGVFLGLLFLLDTVLIIYYKQLAEGYEDESRYRVMRSVGMDRDIVRRSVNSQLLVVFFAPLAVTAVHLAFNFSLVSQLLTLFGLRNIGLELLCTLGTLALFLLLYAGAYRLTARAYDKIVG